MVSIKFDWRCQNKTESVLKTNRRREERGRDLGCGLGNDPPHPPESRRLRHLQSNRVARWTAIASAPVEFPILALFEHGLEHLEIERRRAAFNAQQTRQITRGFCRIPKVREQLHYAVRHVAVAHEHDTLIVDFGADDFAGQLQPHAGQLKQTVLSAPRVHAAGGQAAQQTKKTTGGGKIGNVYSKLKACLDGLRGDSQS
jgi:hypothetical protein